MPALTKRTSIEPSLILASAASVSSSPTRALFAVNVSTLPPSAVFALDNRPESLPVIATRAPSAKNNCAVANPIPEFPPVISAVLPASFDIECSPESDTNGRLFKRAADWRFNQTVRDVPAGTTSIHQLSFRFTAVANRFWLVPIDGVRRRKQLRQLDISRRIAQIIRQSLSIKWNTKFHYWECGYEARKRIRRR